LITEFISGHM